MKKLDDADNVCPRRSNSMDPRSPETRNGNQILNQLEEAMDAALLRGCRVTQKYLSTEDLTPSLETALSVAMGRTVKEWMD